MTTREVAGLDTSDQRWLALYRDLRHEVMNHLQVILGWLQMSRPDRAQRYVHEVAEQLAAASVLVRQPPALAACLLAVHQQGARLGIAMAWDIEPGAAAAALAALAPLGTVLEAAVAAAAGAARLQVRLAVRPAGLAVWLAQAGGPGWAAAGAAAGGATGAAAGAAAVALAVALAKAIGAAEAAGIAVELAHTSGEL